MGEERGREVEEGEGEERDQRWGAAGQRIGKDRRQVRCRSEGDLGCVRGRRAGPVAVGQEDFHQYLRQGQPQGCVVAERNGIGIRNECPDEPKCSLGQEGQAVVE